MPRITAPTVPEHRRRMREALLDAAEELLADPATRALGLEAVAARVGIARTSVYRYFDGVEDLVEAVIARDFPRWEGAVRAAVAATARGETGPAAAAGRILAYVSANLAEAAGGGHRWRAGLGRVALSPAGRRRIGELHAGLLDVLRETVAECAPARPELLTAHVQALVDAGITRIDRGDDAAVVTAYTSAAARAVLDAWTRVSPAG